MGMKVAICNTKHTVKGDFICKNFSKGVLKCGDIPIDVGVYGKHVKLLKRADVIVQICYYNKNKQDSDHRKPDNDFRRSIKSFVDKHKKRMITIETAFIKNQHQLVDIDPFRFKTKKLLQETLKTVYYSVGYDGIKGSGNYYNKNSPSDRWTKLNIQLKSWRNSGENILLLGQTYHGQSSQDIDIYLWYESTISKIRKISNRPIIYRMHPRNLKVHKRYKREIQKFQKLRVKYSNIEVSNNKYIKDDLHNLYCAICYTTNGIIDPLIAGIPIITLSPDCIAWPVASHEILKIVKPDREQFFNDIAYTQWNCDEMFKGLPWKHLRPYYEKVV